MFDGVLVAVQERLLPALQPVCTTFAGISTSLLRDLNYPHPAYLEPLNEPGYGTEGQAARNPEPSHPPRMSTERLPV